jgi:hypothetical protein
MQGSSITVSIYGLAYRFRSNAPPSQQQHPREYGGAVGWWGVVGGVLRTIAPARNDFKDVINSNKPI